MEKTRSAPRQGLGEYVMSQSSAWIAMEKQYYAQTVRRQPVVLVRGRRGWRMSPAITAIYNQGIEERNATFRIGPRTVEQVTAQLAEKGERYPKCNGKSLLTFARPYT
jgi:hypothetical protein